MARPPRTRHDRPGRPQLGPEAKRGRPLSMRLSPAEWDALTPRAAAVGMAPTAYARLAIFGALPPVIPEVNRAAYGELARLAGNLNQLTERVNAGRVTVLQGSDAVLLERIGAEVHALRLALIGRKVESGSGSAARVPAPSPAEAAS